MIKPIGEARTRLFLGAVGVCSFFLLMVLEVVTENDEVEFVDMLVDGVGLLLMVSTTVGLALLFLRMHAQHEEKLNLIRDLNIARSEGKTWRAKANVHLSGLLAELNSQFDDWGMTAAEKEVGKLILKGLSHKEIASLRGTAEATVRQQAQAIYQKSKLPGKTAFSAYFLEDLLASDHVLTNDVRQAS